MKKNIIQLLIAFIIALLLCSFILDIIGYLVYEKGYDAFITGVVVILLFIFICMFILKKIKRSLLEKEMIEFFKKNNKKWKNSSFFLEFYDYKKNWVYNSVIKNSWLAKTCTCLHTRVSWQLLARIIWRRMCKWN